MSNELNVQIWGTAVIGKNEVHNWFTDVSPLDYNRTVRRVRVFSAVPWVPAPDPGGGLPLPPDPPYPPYEQRVAVTQVFNLLKATPPVPQGVYPPGAPALQINVIVENLSVDDVPVVYQLVEAETDN